MGPLVVPSHICCIITSIRIFVIVPVYNIDGFNEYQDVYILYDTELFINLVDYVEMMNIYLSLLLFLGAFVFRVCPFIQGSIVVIEYLLHRQDV
jgi:hypothetical protein